MEYTRPVGRSIALTVSALVVIAVVGITFINERQASTPPVTETASTVSSAVSASVPTQSAPSSPVAQTPTTSTTPPVAVPKRYIYKNGTYTATGLYMSPGGDDQITVTLTLTNDIVASASVTPGAGDRTSQRYQDAFISGYQQYVVGQNIDSIDLTVVSGSSLTPVGFNDALAQIKAQAKA